ncbi:MAG: hypothetical protein ACRDTG_23480 [Pseudonocardiaceae bacterium]
MRLLQAAIDEALDLDEVVQAMRRGRTTAEDVRTRLAPRHAGFLKAVRPELAEYEQLAQVRTFIAHTIRKVVDPFWMQLNRDVKRPFDPLTRLLWPAVTILLLAVPQMLDRPYGGSIRRSVAYTGMFLYWMFLAAVFVLPVGLYFFGLLSAWVAWPGIGLMSSAAVVLVCGLGIRLVRNLRHPVSPVVDVFDQRRALEPRLKALVQEDPDHRATTAKLDELGRRIQRKLVEQSVLPAIRTLLNTTLRDQQNGEVADPREFLVIGGPGLSEVDDQRFEIRTTSMSRLTRLLSQLPGGSIGLSGPRGIGKTTILRSITTDTVDVWKADKTLQVYLPAPVHYVAIEFISHLAAEICSAIVSPAARAAIREKVEPQEQAAEQARSFGTWLCGLLLAQWTWRLIGLALVSILYVLVATGVASSLPDGRARSLIPLFAPIVLVVAALVLGAIAHRRPSGAVATCVQLWVHWWAIMVSLGVAGYIVIGARLWELRVPIAIWSSVVVTTALIGAIVVHRTRSTALHAPTTNSVNSTHGTEFRDTAVGPPAALQGEAEALLEALTFTESKLSGSESKMMTGTSVGIELKGEVSQSQQITRARRNMTMSELVAQLRQLIQHATSYGRVLIAVDELDKIDSEVDARRFINDLKAIFGVHRSYFVVAVSQDAMVSFERCGLAIRTEIDSAFDEVIYASQLTLAETRALLERRVIGLSEPFARLCYCLSGGLPRDAIRSMRNIVNAGLAVDGRVWISDVAETVLVDEMARYATATLSQRDSPEQMWPPEVFHALAAVRRRSVHPAEFRALAAQVAASPESEPDSPKLARLRWELQILLRFYAETFQLFAAESVSEAHATNRLEQLAQARRDLAQNLSLAAQAIDVDPETATREDTRPSNGRQPENKRQKINQ